MGLAASQARLLSLTARIHDVEYQAQMIQNAKLDLAIKEDEVYRKYTEALDATTLTFKDMQGNRIAASYYNLAGEGSIGNNIAGDKQYIFRNSSDQLIVPQNIYDSYVELFGSDSCGDPYEFAMHMMGVDTQDPGYEQTVEEVATENEDYSYLQSIRQQIDDEVNKIAGKSRSINMAGDDKDASINDLKEAIYSRNTINIKQFFDDDTYDEIADTIKTIQERQDEYQYKLYKRAGKQIYERTGTGEANDFDQEKFNYYLLYGKLIQQEEGIRYVSTMSSYDGDGYEKDSQFLQDMLKAGKIRVETANFGSKGEVEDSTTSVPSDSNLEYTATSSIDKKAVALAEAEYEYEMKKIDRKDKQYDTDLNKLETERTALTTEYDSVKKVIQDNIERTFGIFS